MNHDTQVLNTRAHTKERIGQLLTFAGQGDRATPTSSAPATSARWPSSRRRSAGDWLAARDEPIEMPAIKLPGAGDGVRDRAQDQGRRGQGVHRAAPPAGGGPDDRPAPRRADRRADRRRPVADPRRGDRRAAEVALRRRGRRCKPPRVPYQETIRGSAKAHGRHKKQTGGRGQFGDCHIEIEPLGRGDGLRVRQRDQGRRDPARASSRRSRRACVEAMAQRRRRRLSRSRACGCALRRLLPHGRLVGDGVQARRLAWR